MDYYKVIYQVHPLEPFSELLMDALGELGFESFEDTEDGFIGYVPENLFDAQALQGIELPFGEESEPKVSFVFEKIAQQNWNAQWESNFEAVEVGTRCYVRAPFHESRPECEFEIVIMPKMSFGTGHHETTHMMLEYVLETNVKEQAVLDMGCGTAVLAILAAMRGAMPVTAIDVDEWAYENSLENVSMNHVPFIRVQQGDAALLGQDMYDVVLANINRNILLADMDAYSAVCKQGGWLIMSGFYLDDLDAIEARAAATGFQKQSYKTRNNWVAAAFKKG